MQNRTLNNQTEVKSATPAKAVIRGRYVKRQDLLTALAEPYKFPEPDEVPIYALSSKRDN